MTLIVKKLLERFIKKNFKKNQTVFRVIEKGDKLSVKQKDYNKCFNGWVDEK